MNAKTNLREYFDKVRKTDYDYEIKRGTLELQRLLNDVTDSEKIGLGALTNLLNGIIRK
jgi:hypothetical protein